MIPKETEVEEVFQAFRYALEISPEIWIIVWYA